MTDDLKIRIFPTAMRRGLNVYLQIGEHKFVKDIVFETIDPDCIVAPSLELPFKQGQVLMDDLWQAGIRPTEGSGSAGSLKATENHLKDMRKIVYKQLDLDS